MLPPGQQRETGTPRAVYAASAVSLALGLVFIFVRAPHPWGWEGFDGYHALGLALARGEPFPTMEVPWGYAYFLSAFYRAFGDRPWIPLSVQSALNALAPMALYALARAWVDRRTATVAAVVCGVFSFNTVYASTQSSDAVCTVLFLAGVLVFVSARRRGRTALFALCGFIIGIAAQFRPNVILIPAVLAAYAWLENRTVRRLAQATMIVAGAIVAITPWVARNYRLTGMLLPTSVHAGVQLWYGTLQTGDTLTSRAHNPRSLFESPSFEYTSLEDQPILVSSAFLTCDSRKPSSAALIYWTADDPVRRSVTADAIEDRRFRFTIPAPHRDAIFYYYFSTQWTSPSLTASTPPRGTEQPYIYFVSRNHLGDLDLRGDLLDVFDLIRLLRRDAWDEPLPFADRLQMIGADTITGAVSKLTTPPGHAEVAGLLAGVTHDERQASLAFADGSTITVPRQWQQRITDAAFAEGIAARLMTSWRSIARLADHSPVDRCAASAEEVRVNEVFYRREPHMMRRYSALAWDNIGRDPIAFVLASLYRAARLFVIAGTSDPKTTSQFSQSRFIYLAGTVATLVYLVLFVAGVAIAWRRHYDVWLPLVLILYVPATIAPVLTNMRYTITVQPLMFIFVAITLVTAYETWRGERPGARRSATA